jgi:hypothetical protein
MPTTTEPAAPSTPAPAPKWWAQSMTIWGALITALATVLPTIGPLLDLDITPELIRELGERVVAVAQAVAGLIGTILTIYGRVRATTSIGRQQITMRV